MDTYLERKFLQCLKEEKAKFSDNALRQTPQDKTEFGFGKLCGIYQGLLLAEQLFNEVIGEEDDRT